MPLSTPLHVSLLVHYNGIVSEFPTRGAPAVEEYIGHLLQAKLLKRRSNKNQRAIAWNLPNITPAEFKTTVKGRHMVDRFCAILSQVYTRSLSGSC